MGEVLIGLDYTLLVEVGKVLVHAVTRSEMESKNKLWV